MCTSEHGLTVRLGSIGPALCTSSYDQGGSATAISIRIHRSSENSLSILDASFLSSRPLGRRIGECWLLRGRAWDPNSREVKKLQQDEFRRINLSRAQRAALIVVLVLQIPIGLLFAHLPGNTCRDGHGSNDDHAGHFRPDRAISLF